MSMLESLVDRSKEIVQRALRPVLVGTSIVALANCDSPTKPKECDPACVEQAALNACGASCIIDKQYVLESASTDKSSVNDGEDVTLRFVVKTTILNNNVINNIANNLDIELSRGIVRHVDQSGAVVEADTLPNPRTGPYQHTLTYTMRNTSPSVERDTLSVQLARRDLTTLNTTPIFRETDRRAFPITVAPAAIDNAPAITLTGASNATTGVAYQATATITDDRGLSRAIFNWGDNTADTVAVTGTATAVNRNHTYATSGAKTITGIVDDNAGQRTQTTQNVTVADPTAPFRAQAIRLYSGMTEETRTPLANARFIISNADSVVKDTTAASGDLTLNLAPGNYTVDMQHPDMIPGYASIVNRADALFRGLNKSNALVNLSHTASGTDVKLYGYDAVVPDVGATYGTRGDSALVFWLNSLSRGGVTNRFTENYRFWPVSAGMSQADIDRLPNMLTMLRACEGSAVVNKVTVSDMGVQAALPTQADGRNIFYVQLDPTMIPSANSQTFHDWGVGLGVNPSIGVVRLRGKFALGSLTDRDLLEPTLLGLGDQGVLIQGDPAILSTTGQYMCSAVNSVPAGTSFRP